MITALRADACGHVGLFRCLLQHLLSHFPHVEKQPVTASAVWRYYFSAMFDAWIAPRFFQWAPPAPQHTVAMQSILQRVIMGRPVPMPHTAEALGTASGAAAAQLSAVTPIATAHDEVLRALLRVPVLVPVGDEVQFASELHLHRRD